MAKNCSALISGLLFGIGLAIAGMNNPVKVLDFLDISGIWDASLLLVLGSAVIITTLGFYFILQQQKPLFDAVFHLPVKNIIDPSLMIGSILFGIGWGISGYCPGSAIAMLANPSIETFIFLPTMFLGWFIVHYYKNNTNKN